MNKGLARRLLFVSGLWGLALSISAEPEPAPLPEPLTLEQALELAENEPHPQLRQYLAARRGARAELEQARAGNDLEININGRLRWVDPSPTVPDDSPHDHHIGLNARKTLFDFGRSAAATRAADHVFEARGKVLADVRQQRKIQVMEAFFEVLLADMRYARDNEAMAVVFVDLDKKRERHALKQVSDLELARLEDSYQQSLQQRRRAQAAQRIARSRLANALNRPGQLPATLIPPSLPDNRREPPEFNALRDYARQHNPLLLALRDELEAAGANIAGARSARHPMVSAVAEVNKWQKEFGSRDDALVGLEVEIPLYTGGRLRAKLAAAQAESDRVQAELAAKSMEIEQELLETWLALQNLYSQREAVEASAYYQEMRLDRNRTLYEMEYTADLGDAMVGQSEVRLREAETEYAIALHWARLEALAGAPLPLAVSPSTEENATP